MKIFLQENDNSGFTFFDSLISLMIFSISVLAVSYLANVLVSYTDICMRKAASLIGKLNEIR